jgi:hypothetical protein
MIGDIAHLSYLGEHSLLHRMNRADMMLSEG